MSDGDVLWAWQYRDGDDSWAIIGALLPGMGHTPLVMRNANNAASVAELAKAHGQAQGRPIRLAKFRLEEAHPE